MRVLLGLAVIYLYIVMSSACHSSIHKRRHKRATTEEIRETINLRGFFARCLEERAGNVFDSYNSIVDLSVLDMRWYENSNDLFCPYDTDTVTCWQTRLTDYISKTSPLLNATRQCILDYAQAVTGSDPLCTTRGWTPYFNRDNPVGFGENEELVHLRNEFPGRICANPHSLEAEVIDKNDKHFQETGHVVRFGPDIGFRCDHRDQPAGTSSCPDYKIRFCCPDPVSVCEDGEWTNYFNRDSPFGRGDFEILESLRSEQPNAICEKPSAIDARTIDGRDYRELNQNVTISLQAGFICLNSDQTYEMCMNYKIRFCCPKIRDASHPWHINNINVKRRSGRFPRQAILDLNTDYENCFSENTVIDDVQQDLNIERIIDFVDNHVICENPIDCSLNGTGNEALTQYWPFKLEASLQLDSPVRRVVQTCNKVVFPLEGWTPWSPWDNCPARCGEVGTQLRRRQCFNGVPGRIPGPCEGDLQDTRVCQPENCPYWSSWGLFGECSRTCGVGLRRRHRVCINGQPGSHGCRGPEFEDSNCDLEPCEDGETYGFSVWTEFENCNAQCGESALQVRRRHCTLGAVGVPGCKGEILDSQICVTTCGTWGEWSEFSMCGDETSCGNSEHERNRTCVGGMPNQPNCYGPSIQKQQCYTGRPCLLGNEARNNIETCNNWGAYSPCSVQCGGVPGVRTRSCIGQNNIQPQTEQCIEFVPCNMETTTMTSVLIWNSWGSYSSCSVTCGIETGTRTRSRTCSGGAPEACRTEVETSECTSTVQCSSATAANEQGFSPWSEYDFCNAQCGQTSTHVRRRHCTTGGQGSSGCMGPIEERKICHPEMECGSWGDWSEFTACGGGRISCGNASRSRSRECNGGTAGGPGCRGQSVDTQQCYTGQTCR